jgi:hypothetical protein
MSSRPRSILAVALVGAVAAVPLAAGSAAATPVRHEAAQVASVQRYVTDATSATSALADFGNDLRSLDSLGEFKSKLPELRRELRSFDASIRRLRVYRLQSKVIEGQRSRLARTGPPLAVTLNKFLNAVRDNDASEVRDLLPKVNADLQRFAKAAQVG